MRQYFHEHLSWIPLSICFMLIVTLILTYFLAVQYEHVFPNFPYISDAGATPPVSCIFGQLLNIVAAFVCLCAYVRYQLVREHIHNVNAIHLRGWNRGSFVLGLLAGFGMSLVANFQVTEFRIMHFIGAAAAFGCGCIYMVLSTYICFQMRRQINPLWICYFRLVCTMWSIAFLIITITFGHLAHLKFRGTTRLKWMPKDGGFTEHVISTSSEWSTALGILIYFFSFARDFHYLSYKPGTIVIQSLNLPEDFVNN